MVSIANDAMNALRRVHAERSGDVDLAHFFSRFRDLDDDEIADLIELDARERLRAGLTVDLPRYMKAIPDLASRRVALDAAIEFALRSLSGSRHTKVEAVEALCGMYPDLVPAISAAWFLNDALGSTTTASVIAQPQVELQLPMGIGPKMATGRPRYELRQKLGVGSHSAVYLGVDYALSDMDRPAYVAVKITGRSDSNSVLAQRLLEEATKARRVTHTNIARVLDRGAMDSGGEFIVYEYVDGGDLQDATDRGRLPRDTRAIAALVAKIARAVQAAHSAGLIHSDLKPSNILLTAAGEPKVADFGLAARRFDLNADTDGLRLGTLGFIAPERYRAEPGSESVLSDVYSLGGVFYYLLTGKAPNGSSADEVADRLGTESEAPQLSELPGADRGDMNDLVAICRRALAPIPTDRYPSADAMANDLEAWLEHRPLRWRNPSKGRLSRLFYLRNQVLCAASGALVLTLFAGTVAIMKMRSDAREELLATELANQEAARQQALTNQALLDAKDADNKNDIMTSIRSVIPVLQSRNSIDSKLFPTLLFAESVAGPQLLKGIGSGDFQDLWTFRLNESTNFIEQAKQRGSFDDSLSLLWRMTRGFWLLQDERFEEASKELELVGDVWAARNGESDTLCMLVRSLRDAADVRLAAAKTAEGVALSEEGMKETREAVARLEGSLESLQSTQNGYREVLKALLDAYGPTLFNDLSMQKKYERTLYR